MTLTITPIYAGLLCLIFIALSWHVIRYRRANMISLGDNDDKALRKRMRAQANFVEYAPLGIILLLLSELQGAPVLALHVMGLALLMGRLLHAIGFTATPQKMILRQIGMVLTLSMLSLTALALVLHRVF